MKFKQFLTEAVSPEAFARQVIEECQPYISDVGPTNIFALKRGLYTNGKNFYAPLRVNQNRTPTDSSKILHNLLNQGFNEAFGIKFRSQSIFCSSNTRVASQYGNSVYYVIPRGDYKACWSSSITDAYNFLKVTGRLS